MITRKSGIHAMKFSLRCAYAGILTLFLLAACTSPTPEPVTAPTAPTAPAAPAATPQPRTLRVMTHDSFAISDEVLAMFESANHVKVQFLKSGDVGTALNKAILSKDNPLADVFYGVDNTFLSRALNEGIFDAYNSPLLADIPAEFKLDAENRALPVDYGDVCLNYDMAYFTKNNLQPPVTLDDLLKPEYKSLLVVENPATSSPGLAFLLTTIGQLRRSGLPGLLEKAGPERRAGRRWLGDRLQYRVLGVCGEGSAPDRRLIQLEPGFRGDLRPTAGRAALHRCRSSAPRPVSARSSSSAS